MTRSGCAFDVLGLVSFDATTVVVEIGGDALQHLELLAGFLPGFAQLSQQQRLCLVWILRQFQPEFMRRRPRLKDRNVIENLDFAARLPRRGGDRRHGLIGLVIGDW